LATLIALATVLTIAGCRDPVAPQASEDKQKTPVTWEYNEKRIFLPLGNLAALREELNKEGDQGWELVSVTPLVPIQETQSGYVQSLGIFKRPKR